MNKSTLPTFTVTRTTGDYMTVQAKSFRVEEVTVYTPERGQQNLLVFETDGERVGQVFLDQVENVEIKSVAATDDEYIHKLGKLARRDAH
jgi:hypothetical protein